MNIINKRSTDLLLSLSLLAITIVIRTILSWTTVLEMNGRWPWQRLPPDAAKS